jgi:hypothetical protein
VTHQFAGEAFEVLLRASGFRDQTGVQFWQAPLPVLRCGEFRPPFLPPIFYQPPFRQNRARAKVKDQG